jgi:hypothetical protein
VSNSQLVIGVDSFGSAPFAVYQNDESLGSVGSNSNRGSKSSRGNRGSKKVSVEIVVKNNYCPIKVYRQSKSLLYRI